jgi:hypothetical protein
MSNVLPTLLSGTVTMLPVTFAKAFATGVVKFIDDSEQRWAGRTERSGFLLNYKNVISYDLDTMLAFFIDLKGKYVDTALENTFSITDSRIPGQPFNYCFFDQDELEETEVTPGFFNFALKIRQARGN